MKSKKVVDLLAATNGARMANKPINPIPLKKFSSRKNLTGLSPEWEAFFELKIKDTHSISYAAYIKKALYAQLKKDGY